MEILSLKTVLDAEMQARALGPASWAALEETALKWQTEQRLGLLTFEDGVATAIDRITSLPR